MVFRSRHYKGFGFNSFSFSLGLTTALVGWFAGSPVLKRSFSRLMLLDHATYTFLDFRASDSMVGESPYKGPDSLAPAIIAFLCVFVFLYLVFVTRISSAADNP